MIIGSPRAKPIDRRPRIIRRNLHSHTLGDKTLIFHHDLHNLYVNRAETQTYAFLADPHAETWEN